ncbi:GmrSD restriction endonuclease domain-containing protein [Caldimonas brevitalea]
MQSTLEQANRPIQMATFLHHYWLSKHPFTTEKELFKAIKSEVSATNVRAVLDELRTDSDLYRGIAEPERLALWNKGNRDVEDSLRCISDVLNIQIANPLLLTVLRLFSAKQLKDGQVREIFWLVERYHYLYTTISNLPSSGGVSKMYAAHARALATAADANARGLCINEFKKKIKTKAPARETFITRFKAHNYLNARHKEIIGYTLWKIYKHQNPAVDVDRQSQSLEHLLSQSTGGAAIHSIGNLLGVPAKYNGEVLAANSFAQKKALLIQHGYILEPQIAAATSWGAAEIEQRTNDLAELAYDQVWAIK